MNLSESVSLTDSVAKSTSVNLSESVTLTDSVCKDQLDVNLSESVSFDRLGLKDSRCESNRICIVDRLGLKGQLM